MSNARLGKNGTCGVYSDGQSREGIIIIDIIINIIIIITVVLVRTSPLNSPPKARFIAKSRHPLLKVDYRCV